MMVICSRAMALDDDGGDDGGDGDGDDGDGDDGGDGADARYGPQAMATPHARISH